MLSTWGAAIFNFAVRVVEVLLTFPVRNPIEEAFQLKILSEKFQLPSSNGTHHKSRMFSTQLLLSVGLQVIQAMNGKL